MREKFHITPAELLEAAPLPPLAEHVWRYFLDLSQTRTSGGFGPSRITRGEIHAWERDEAIELEAWERRAILLIDALYVAETVKQQSREA